MARIETLTPALKKGTWTLNAASLTFQPEDVSCLAVELPFEALHFVKMLNGAFSLSEIIRNLHQKGVHFRYASIIASLRTLSQNHLFRNNETVEQHLNSLETEDVTEDTPQKRQFNRDYFSKERVLSLLKKTPIGAHISNEAMELILQNSKLMHVPPKHKLIESDSIGQELFVLLAGSIGVYQRPDEYEHAKFLAKLSPVSVFGESSAVFNKPRTATVVALEKSWVLNVNIQNVVNVKKPATFDSFQSLRTRLLVNQILQEAPLFKGVPSDALQLFTTRCQLMAAENDQIILEQGQPAENLEETLSSPAFYFVVRGSVSVIRDGKWICDLEKGDYFGEIGTLSNTYRTATIKTNTPCNFLTLSARALNEVLANNISLAIHLEKMADQRAQESLQQGDMTSGSNGSDPMIDAFSIADKHAHFDFESELSEISNNSASLEDEKSITNLFDFSLEEVTSDEEQQEYTNADVSENGNIDDPEEEH